LVVLWVSVIPDAGVRVLAVNQVVPVSWREVFRFRWLQWNWASFFMDELDRVEAFTWRRGRDVVTLKRAGDSWQVACITQGKLMGPRQKVYEATHRQAKFAAWDVMSKVISVSHDEDEGVEVAVEAAQWMRQTGASSGEVSRA
jgi:hypothetical protein